MTGRGVLLVVLVRDDVPEDPLVLPSLRRLGEGPVPPDVLFLDDTDLGCPAAAAAVRGAHPGYYRLPQRLGVPRSLNLAARVAVEGGYAHMVLVNATTVLPPDFIGRLVAVAERDGSIGSVTAWSTNAPGLSLPNEDPERFLQDVDVVGLVSAGLTDHYGDVALDVPTSSLFATLVPTPVLRAVGAFDPVFSPHSAESTDWCLRSRRLGYRVVLAPGVFAYHAGPGVQADPTRAAASEDAFATDVLAMRYPLFRDQVRAFSTDGILEEATVFGVDAIIRRIASSRGWTVELGWAGAAAPGGPVRALLHPEHRDSVRLVAEGFAQSLVMPGEDPVPHLTARLGVGPLTGTEETDGVLDGVAVREHTLERG